MHARTAFRLAMLANGYWPLLNECKRAIETGWPKRRPDEAEILSWDRSALTSTGLKLDGDLAVIDVDVSEPDLVEALASALNSCFPELFIHGLVRHAGGPKEAWIARVDEPFRRLASRRWYRGSDPDDPAVPKHCVECFGSLGTRQFAIDGPHARDRRGEVISTYQFAGGASPATVPRASLPLLPKAAYAQACNLFDEIAAAAGLTAVKETRGMAAARCFELDAGMVVETQDHGEMTVAELERFMRQRRARGDAPADAALLRHLPRSDAGADRFASHQLGPVRPRHLRHHDGDDLAPARAGAVRAVRIFRPITSKEPVPMNDNSRASSNASDGEAISRADREFLASLGDHPLMRHPLYSVPPPPRPDYSGCTTIYEKTRVQQACFPAALDWMLVNYAYCKSAFMGKGGVISLVDGELGTIASLRGFMQPYTIVEEGPRGGLKKTSVVDTWMTHPLRPHIDAIQCRSDKPRPTFEEDGLIVYNRYWPPTHPTSGGEIVVFETFFARLIPDVVERAWFWHWLAHKARRPWVPMVAIIMVAEEFGTGRGTLFGILELLFGKDYVVPCTFGELTGTSRGAHFNARMADALFVVIDEAIAEDGHQQTQRRLHYDALKNAADPSPTQRRRYEAKGQHAYAQPSAASVITATQHRDVVKLPHDDRRFEVLTCGRKMAPAERVEIRAWMAVLENIGALHRALLATPAASLDVFDPYGVPPPFAGRLEMIGMGVTRLEDAYLAAIDALDGFPLFTLTQAKRLIGYFGNYASGDWVDRALHTVGKHAYRLYERTRIRHQGRREPVYARTAAERQSWRPAEKAMIAAALERTEKRIVQIIGGGRAPFQNAKASPWWSTWWSATVAGTTSPRVSRHIRQTGSLLNCRRLIFRQRSS